jgi:hypothetical protein
MNCKAQTTLVWQAVPFIRSDDKYIVHLGYVDGVGDGNQETVTWLLFQHVPASRTSWELNGDYCQYGKQQFGRQWRWWVEVVEEVGGELSPVSPPSPIWGFSWN